MASSNPVWHNIFRNIVLKPDNITFEAETYKDTLNILRGPGVAWVGSSDQDTLLATGNDTFMINVDYDISIPVSTTKLSLEDVNGNLSEVTFTAGRGVAIIRNSAQELTWESYSVTETDTLQSVTERNNITNNKIFVNNIEVGTVSSSFTEDGFPSYDAGHNLIGDGTLDNVLQFSPEYQDSIAANNTDQFEFTALGPGTLAYSASYQFDTGATTGSVVLEREDPSSPGTWVVLDNISGVISGYSYAIQGIYSELYSGNVNYRLTYSWTGNLGVITWHVQNTFEGGAYTPITNPQFKTDTDAKTVDINDLQFFQNNIRTTVSNTDIVLDPAGTGMVYANSELFIKQRLLFDGSNIGIGQYTVSGVLSGITDNIAIGNSAFESSYTSSGARRNIAIGAYALNGGNAREGNVVIGDVAASYNFSGDGSENVIIGHLSTPKLTSGNENVILGHRSAFELGAGSGNIALGYQAGDTITSGTNNIVIGYDADVAANNNTNSIVIGYQAVGLGSNTTVIGNASTTSTTIYGAVTASVVNAVYTTNSYADPNWITSLDASKIVGSIALSDITIDGDLRLFDNVISTTTSNSDIVLDPNGTGKVVSISNISAPTFEGNLTGNVTGNADTVTNGIYTNISYADPSWITSLDASKIVGSIALSDITLDGTIRIYDNVIETVVSNANLELRANGTGIVNVTDTLTAVAIENTPIGSSTRNSGAFTTLAANNTTTLQQITEILNTKTSATGVVNHDYSTGDIWYHSSISANFTVNLTNVPTTNDRTIVVTIVLNQGVAGFYPNVFQIDGTPVSIRWANNVTPTPSTSKIDVASFTLIRTGSTWYVLGNYTTYN